MKGVWNVHALTRLNRHVGSSAPLLAIFAGAILSFGLAASDADAQAGGFRKGGVKGEAGAAARSRGFVTNGGEWGAARRGAVASDGQGSGFARRGGCVDGAAGAGCRGGAVTRGADGSVSARSGAEFNGDHGSLSRRRAFERDADGALAGQRSTDASGARGSYNGEASLESGVYHRDGVYTGSDGRSAAVEGGYERGVGGARSVTCTNASGAVVACP